MRLLRPVGRKKFILAIPLKGGGVGISRVLLRLWPLIRIAGALWRRPCQGNSEFWDRETVYLYEQEGLASALRWDPDTGRMQVFLGAGRTLLPRIQSMDANFVTVNAEMADVVPWKNRMMMTEKLSRATARMLLIIGIILSLFIFSILIFQYVLTNTVQRDLRKVKAETNRVSQQMMIEAYNALQSDTIKHMVRIQELLDELRTIDGTLVKYEVKGKKLTWEVLVPPAYGQGVGTIRGKCYQGLNLMGVYV